MKSAIRTATPNSEAAFHACAHPNPHRAHRRPQPSAGGLSSPAAWLALALLAVGCCAQAAPNKSAKADPSTNAPAAALETEIPQSVFVIPASAREGRNPFFPHSAVVQPTLKPKPNVLDTSSIVLNGITSRPRPSVMINGITFEKGEEHELRVANGGKVKVRCEDIRPDSAVVLVNGLEQRELRMRTGL